MDNYVITADATADLYNEFYEKNQIDIVAMPYNIGLLEYGVDKQLSFPDFYNVMRNGGMPTTSQISIDSAYKVLEKNLAEGRDVLHISFSSGMSGSYDSMCMVAKDLLTKYPKRRVIIIDSLSGAGGEGLMLYYAVKMQKEGKSIDEVAAWCNDNKLNIHHFFIVDDLNHLRRGGRVSKIEALLGTILGIKPVLELNDQGKIMPVAKARGARRAAEIMCEMTAKYYDPDKNDFVLIGHGDILATAKVFGDNIAAAVGAKRVEYCYVDYLVGSHAGPNNLAVFFVGASRVR